jgi:hypothetical protein
MLGLVIFFLALVAAAPSGHYDETSPWWQALHHGGGDQGGNGQNKRATPMPATIVADEQGNGQLIFPPPTPSTTNPATLRSDPGPGGLASALTFDLQGPPALVAGDVFLVGPLGNTVNVIRFNPVATGGSFYPAAMLYYSLGPQVDSCIADTGFPTANYGTTLSIPVGCPGVVTYTPTTLQPGFVPGFTTTYQLNGCPSDLCTGTE